MQIHKYFEFLPVSQFQPAASALVGILPEHIATTPQLLDEVARVLHFPAYFGANWSALADCLRDLHWVDEKEVVLVHRDIPAIPERDLKTYLEVLHEAVNDWKPDEDHQFTVIFEKSMERQVLAALPAAD